MQKILQHYYTSFINRQTGNAGFQVKAQSSGLLSDAQSLITRLIAYRIPPTLDERAFNTHPVALRYYFDERSQRAYLLCSQSNGSDENGRPGNFFAHTLVLEPEHFKQNPPIFYWGSSFWIKKDTSTSSVLDPLSPEDMVPALDSEEVWTFLKGRKRLAHFTKLMAAVVHAHRTRRRIVIIDSTEHIALWIAAVSCMLPEDYRPLLSFATYHHDPYQSPFLITGTTSDSLFRASADEYMTFFILNVEEDQISDVDSSPYAEEAERAGQSIEEYETRLLSLFSEYVRRFPPPERIDDRLDQLADYAHILSPQKVSSQTMNLEAINAVLTRFEQSPYFNQEDVDEIDKLHEILQDAWAKQRDKAIEQALLRIIQLHKKHNKPTDALIMRALQEASQLLLKAVNAKPEEAKRDFASICQSYGDALFIQTVNHPGYWNWLNPKLDHLDVRQLTDIWLCLGSFVQFGARSEKFLLVTLQTWGQLWNEKQGKSLYDAIAGACTGREDELLRFAVDHNHLLLPSPSTLIRFYCGLVYNFDLPKRTSYRAIVRQVVPDIAKHELLYQMHMAKKHKDLNIDLQELERWIVYAKRYRIEEDVPALVYEGLGYLKKIAVQVPEKWERLASRILVSKALEPLPLAWEDELVGVALSKVSLNNFTEADLDMCEKYGKRRGIEAERRVVIGGLLAMKYGQLDRELSEGLLGYFKAHAKEQYMQEARSFVLNFFAHPLREQEHNLMVDAVFSWSCPAYFWGPYWEAVAQRFTDAGQAEQIANVLGYWFAAMPETFQRKWIPQHFFLQLPGQIEQWQKERAFPAVAQQIITIIANRKKAWQPLLQELLGSKKNVLVSAVGVVGQGLQLLRRSDKQAEKVQEEQRQRDAFSDSVAKLFKPKEVRKAHRRDLQQTYQIKQRELFWECYWQHMTNLMLSAEAGQVLDLLAFWFEDGYSVLKQQHYLVPAFFLGFVDTLDRARKDRRFGESAQRVHECVQKKPPDWYGLVEEYFVIEPERRGFLRFPRPRA